MGQCHQQHRPPRYRQQGEPDADGHAEKRQPPRGPAQDPAASGIVIMPIPKKMILKGPMSTPAAWM